MEELDMTTLDLGLGLDGLGDLGDLDANDSDDYEDLLLLPELEQFSVEDDPEVLRAALDFIEACDAHDFLSGDDSDDTSSLAPVSPAPSGHSEELKDDPKEESKEEKSKPRRVTRNRRKEEIAELRVLVAELEQQVAGRKRKLHHVPATLPYALGASDTNAVDVGVVWEHISKRQVQQRQLAELENAKLRNMVTDQLKIARELTREAKRRAVLEGRAALPFDGLFEEPAHANESPLMVRIYPSRPSMHARVGGLAMPLSSGPNGFTKHEYNQTDAELLEGTPIGAAWMSAAVASATAQESQAATRITWQAALRQFLKRRRAACCHERVEDILESAISHVDAKKHDDNEADKARGLVYTHRYDECTSDNVAVTESTPSVTTWRANDAWQSPSALLSTLLSSHTKKTVNLRLFRLEKPVVREGTSSDDIEAVAARLGGLSLRKTMVPPCAASGALQNWHRASSLQTSSCF